MNHCGQSPSSFWLRNTRSNSSRTGAARPSESSNSTGPWHTSRVPQPPPEYCSRPRGARWWIHASCASQGRMAATRVTSTDAGASRTSGPVMPCQKRAAAAASLAHRSAASVLTASGGAATSCPVMRNPTDVAGAVISTTKGWPRERPSAKSNSSPPTRSIAVPGVDVDAKRTVGKAASHVGVGQARDDHTPARRASSARARRPSRRRRSARRGWTRESGTGRRPARAP